MDALLGLVRSGIAAEWGTAEGEGLAWDGEKQRYLGPTRDTYDLLHGELEPISDVPAVNRDLIASLPDSTWCPHDPWSATWTERMSSAWAAFEDLIKHRRRFFFGNGASGHEDEELARVHFTLHGIRKGLRTCAMTRVLPRGTEIQRVRIAPPGRIYSRVKDLGPPPAELTLQSNRLSPPGIPMFYGACDEETALAETWEPALGPRTASIGTFQALRDLRVLDLARLPSFPSLWDARKRARRPFIRFMREFTEHVSRPAPRDDRIHLEHVPTQVLTEFLRVHGLGDDHEPLDGILYASARRPGGHSLALFLESGECVDSLRPRPGERRPPILLLVGRRTRELR